MSSQCAHYKCGCDCGVEHVDVPDGPWVPFNYTLLGGGVMRDLGGVLTHCPCTGRSFAHVVGGAQWGRVMT